MRVVLGVESGAVQAAATVMLGEGYGIMAGVAGGGDSALCSEGMVSTRVVLLRGASNMVSQYMSMIYVYWWSSSRNA